MSVLCPKAAHAPQQRTSCRPSEFLGGRVFGSRGSHELQSISKRSDQSGGGVGRGGFGPKARAVSRCGRLTLERASCRAYSLSPSSLYCGLVSDARNATRSSISGSVSASGCISSSSHGSVTPSPLL